MRPSGFLAAPGSVKGMENIEVLCVAFVAVAVTFGPVSDPPKLQFPDPSAETAPW